MSPRPRGHHGNYYYAAGRDDDHCDELLDEHADDGIYNYKKLNILINKEDHKGSETNENKSGVAVKKKLH